MRKVSMVRVMEDGRRVSSQDDDDDDGGINDDFNGARSETTAAAVGDGVDAATALAVNATADLLPWNASNHECMVFSDEASLSLTLLVSLTPNTHVHTRSTTTTSFRRSFPLFAIA